MAKTYFGMVKEDAREWIEDNDYRIIWSDYENADAAIQDFEDELFVCDSVTGNASGSYYFNSAKAMDTVTGNMSDVMEALIEFGYSAKEIGEMFIEDEWEKIDVITRCYYLASALWDIADEEDFEAIIEEAKEEATAAERIQETEATAETKTA